MVHYACLMPESACSIALPNLLGRRVGEFGPFSHGHRPSTGGVGALAGRAL